VIRSFELRWFFSRHPAGEIKDWFCGSKLCKEEEARTDHYLVLPSNEVGIKVRDGKQFEIKARTRSPEPFWLETGASVGRQDAWVKWSLDDCEAAGRLATIGGGSSEWVPVVKQRWLRKFEVDAAGVVEETDVDAVLEHGCRVELGDLEVRDSHWWTLALASFGEVNRTAHLEQVARHFLRMLPRGVELTERDSMAYPEWLNGLAG